MEGEGSAGLSPVVTAPTHPAPPLSLARRRCLWRGVPRDDRTRRATEVHPPCWVSTGDVPSVPIVPGRPSAAAERRDQGTKVTGVQHPHSRRCRCRLTDRSAVHPAGLCTDLTGRQARRPPSPPRLGMDPTGLRATRRFVSACSSPHSREGPVTGAEVTHAAVFTCKRETGDGGQARNPAVGAGRSDLIGSRVRWRRPASGG